MPLTFESQLQRLYILSIYSSKKSIYSPASHGAQTPQSEMINTLEAKMPPKLIKLLPKPRYGAKKSPVFNFYTQYHTSEGAVFLNISTFANAILILCNNSINNKLISLHFRHDIVCFSSILPMERDFQTVEPSQSNTVSGSVAE